MSRVTKEYKVRRTEILDAAQRLFFRKGYEQTSVQDIIDEIDIAKGTFYHYFNSKLDLLDALIEQMLAQTLQAVEPIVNDEQLNASEKITRFFSYIESWKSKNKAFFLEVLRVWHKDKNAIFRQKMSAETIRAVAPILAQIIEQGVAEGVFATNYPNDLAEIVLQIAQSLSEAAAELLLNMERDNHNTHNTLDVITRKAVAHECAIERVLDAPSGSLNIFDLDRIKLWFE